MMTSEPSKIRVDLECCTNTRSTCPSIFINMASRISTHISDELADVFRVRYAGSYWVLGLWDDWPLVYSPHAPWLAHDVLESLGLLQLTQVIVLQHG